MLNYLVDATDVKVVFISLGNTNGKKSISLGRGVSVIGKIGVWKKELGIVFVKKSGGGSVVCWGSVDCHLGIV